MEIFLRENGVVGGVCGGAAKRLGLPAWGIRLALFVSIFLSFGVTVLLYISAMVAFPHAASSSKAEPKFLGVCHRLAPRLGIHETWLRFITLVAWIATAFITVFALYMVVFLVMLLISVDKDAVKNTAGTRDVN